MGFGANSDHFGTSEDLHRRPGGILGAKLAYFWPSKVPKLPQIGSKCIISVWLTPVGCLVVFYTFLEQLWTRLGFSPSEELDFLPSELKN